MESLLARVNYQRDKRQKDLARQRKQEEKRQKKLQKDLNPDAPAELQDGESAEEAADGETEATDGAADGETEAAPAESPE